MYTIEVSIQGTMPLLMHRHPLPVEEKVIISKPGKPEDQEWAGSFELSKYQTEAGVLYQPASHVHGALQKAALNFQIPGKGRKTYKDLIKSSILIEPDVIIHKIQDCIPDHQWARIKTSSILRTRAKLPKWELDFDLIVLENQIPEEALSQILTYAGSYVGIGDYRPKFGRFLVAKFNKKKK